MYIFQDLWLQTLWGQDPWLQDISDLWRTPGHSSLFWPVPGCLRRHVRWTTSSGKTLDPKQRGISLSLFPFPSESPRQSICYTLSLTLFHKLCSRFCSACVWFLPCVMPRTILADPLGSSLGPRTQSACIKSCQKCLPQLYSSLQNLKATSILQEVNAQTVVHPDNGISFNTC